MVVNHRRSGDQLAVSLEGELDQHAADAVRGELDDLLADQAIHTLIMDMSAVGFMDSSGIGVVLGRYRIIAQRGGRMYIRNPGTRINRILEMSGVYRMVERL